jgi:hypothetical protein
MEKTAVEWLEEQIKKFHNWKINPAFDENCFDEIELAKAIQKAKEIEKQLIVEAFTDGTNYNKAKGIVITPDEENHYLGKQYYNETLNK